jgi:hypothetical protein
MGTYTEFEVNGYQLLTTKSAVVPEIMTVFQESDRREFSRPIDAGDAEDVRTVVRYESTASRIIDRLEAGHAWVDADQSKNGKPIAVPLNATALEVLRRQLGKHPKRVFTYAGKPLATANTRAW